MPPKEPPADKPSTTLTDSLKTLQKIIPEIDRKRDLLKQLQHDADQLKPILLGLKSFEELARQEITRDEEKLTMHRIEQQSSTTENTRLNIRQRNENTRKNQRLLKHLAEQIPALETREQKLDNEIAETESEIQTLTNQRDDSIKHLQTYANLNHY